MKKIVTILYIAAAMILTSCEGPMGPPGFDGIDGVDGLDGDSFIGSIFEIEGDFEASNDFMLYFEFPSNFEIYDTDVVLVYILWEQVDGLDVWRLLPQTVVLPEGVIQYNFDYTVNDVQVFMEGTVPTEDWLPAETDDQIFRIAVLPADFTAKKSVDVSDFNTILNAPKLKLNTIKDVSFTNIEKDL